MEASLWSRLPEELLHLVLAHLSPQRFLKLRPTCRAFSNLILSPSFIYLHSPNRASLSFLLMSHPNHRTQLHLYEPISSQWRLLPFALSTHPIFSMAGLLCFFNGSCFLLCNPITKSSRLVPCPNLKFLFLTMIPGETPSSYRIFMVSGSLDCWLYDSTVTRWKKTWVFDEKAAMDLERSGGVFSNGLLVFSRSNPFSVTGFRLETREWEELAGDSPENHHFWPEDLVFSRLVTCEGRVFMVGGIGVHGREREKDWDEIERVPVMISRKLFSVCFHNFELVWCVGIEGMICVCCLTWPEVLVFKVGRGTWHWLSV
ncbi:hypothetical protein AMTRI_Chr12g237890 [Amborella trichopoda]